MKYFFLFICFLLIFVLSCTKPAEEEYKSPKVYAIQPLNITNESAVFRATFISGSEKIKEFGFEWRIITDTIYKKTTVQGYKDNFSFTATHLEEDTLYAVRSFIANADSIWYSNEFSFLTKGTVTDIDGNIYLTMRYGISVWMTENLRVIRFADGTPIEGRTSGKNDDLDGPVFYNDNNHTSNLSNPNFGLLYNWAAAAKAPDCNTHFFPNPLLPEANRGICPKGWHLPTTLDWEKLISIYGGRDIAAIELKSTNWTDYPLEANNYSQFSIEPAGYYDWDENGGFKGLFQYAVFWTSDDNPLSTGVSASAIMTASKLTKIMPLIQMKKEGYSVRCVKN